MTHQHDRLPRAALGNGSHDSRLGKRIEIARRLVKQHERSVVQEHAGQTDALTLTAGQAVAQLTHRRVVARRQSLD